MMIFGYDILDDLGPRQTDTTQTVVAEAETVDDRTPADFYREVVDQACTHLVTFRLDFRDVGKNELMYRILSHIIDVQQAHFPECPLPQVVARLDKHIVGSGCTDESFKTLSESIDCEHVITDAAHDLDATYKIPLSLKNGTRRNITRLMNFCAAIYAVYKHFPNTCQLFNACIYPIHPGEGPVCIYFGQVLDVLHNKKFWKIYASDNHNDKERRDRSATINVMSLIFRNYAGIEEVTSVVHSWFNKYSNEDERMDYSQDELLALMAAAKLARNSIYGNLTNKQ